jgi:small subunit ribosomal protein S6
MRHYEIVFLVHPDRSEQVREITKRYSAVFEKNGGAVHRLEDWGRRQLAYSIKKLHKAHYILMNVECSVETLDEIKQIFRYNDDILRYLVLNRDTAITQPSPMMHQESGFSKYDKRKKKTNRMCRIKLNQMLSRQTQKPA